MTRTVLQPGSRGGPLVRDTRGWRIVAEPDTSVVVHDPNGTSRVLARPGEIDRVVLVRGADLRRRLGGRRAHRDVIAFLSDDAVLLTVPVETLHLGTQQTIDPDFMRATSGASDFALAIGRTLEPATAEEVARVNAAPEAFTRGPTHDALSRRRWLHAGLLLWVALCVVVIIAADNARPVTDVAVLALVVPALFLTVDLWRLRHAFLDQQPPAPDDRAVVPNVLGPDRWQWLRDSQLQIGADEVVHTEHVRETRLPGPRRGGVVTCAVSPDAIWFLDRLDVPLLVLPADRWIMPGQGADALEMACLGAAIEVRLRQQPDAPPFLAANEDPAVYAGSQAISYLVTSLERGVPVPGTAWVIGVLLFGLGAGNLALMVPEGFEVLRLLLGLLALAATGALVVLEWKDRRWHKRQMAIATREAVHA